MKANDPSFQNFMAAFQNKHISFMKQGMSVLAFENTTKQAPGTVNIDAALVANAGYFASEDSRGFFFANAHTSFLIQVMIKIVLLQNWVYWVMDGLKHL